jgi:hypothetical protein
MQNPTPQLYGAAVAKPGVYIGVRPPRGVLVKSDQAGRRQGVRNRLRSARFSQAGAVLRRPAAPSPATGRKCEQDNISDHCARMREILVGAAAIVDRSDRMHARQFAGGLPASSNFSPAVNRRRSPSRKRSPGLVSRRWPAKTPAARCAESCAMHAGVARVHRRSAATSARDARSVPPRPQTAPTSAYPCEAGKSEAPGRQRGAALACRGDAGPPMQVCMARRPADPRLPAATFFVRTHDFSTRGGANQLRCDHFMNLTLASTWGCGWRAARGCSASPDRHPVLGIADADPKPLIRT